MLLANQNSSTLYGLPDGPDGTRRTLEIMADLVRQYRKNDQIRQLAANLVKDVTPKDWIGEIKAIRDYVQNEIRYTRDVYDTETLHTPDEIIFRKHGDCDDKSLLVATLLQAIGHPARFVAIGFVPDEYSHVYPETRIGTRWFTVETTEPVELGWIPPGIQARKIVHI